MKIMSNVKPEVSRQKRKEQRITLHTVSHATHARATHTSSSNQCNGSAAFSRWEGGNVRRGWAKPEGEGWEGWAGEGGWGGGVEGGVLIRVWSLDGWNLSRLAPGQEIDRADKCSPGICGDYD